MSRKTLTVDSDTIDKAIDELAKLMLRLDKNPKKTRKELNTIKKIQEIRERRVDPENELTITTTCYLGTGNAEVTFSPWGLIPALSNESGSIFATAATGDEVIFDWDSSDDEVLIEGGSCNAQIIA